MRRRLAALALLTLSLSLVAAAGWTGGGWEGLYIDYWVDGDHEVLRIDHDMKICGTRVSCET